MKLVMCLSNIVHRIASFRIVIQAVFGLSIEMVKICPMSVHERNEKYQELEKVLWKGAMRRRDYRSQYNSLLMNRSVIDVIQSTVRISMKEDNTLNCSYAVITKDEISIILILRDCECAIYDYQDLCTKENYHYLLLKHYNNTSFAYQDFLKLIGKMCKKSKDSKYFTQRIEEDNRIVFESFEQEHMIKDDEKGIYQERLIDFGNFMQQTKGLLSIL